MQDITKIITSNKFKHLLVENELRKLQNFDAGYFRGKNHFEEDGTLNYLVFQPVSVSVLIVSVISQGGSLKDCLMKVSKLLAHLIIFFILY